MKYSQVIYINGFKASGKDFELLCQRVREGKECIISVRTTKMGNIAITTV